jgi:hypothetical protein
MHQNLKENTVWAGSNYAQFKIDRVQGTGDLAVIYYSKVQAPEIKYSCLVGAFLNRFTYTES